MATDCYQKFKDTYNQGIADGLATAVAQLAAQSVMDDCLRQQSALLTPAQPITTVPGTALPDEGPAFGGALGPHDRGGLLGTRQK